MKRIGKLRSVLAVALVLCMLGQSFAMAADAKAEDVLTFQAADDNDVTASLLEEPVETLTETEPAYEDTDMVRVSIMVEGNSTIDQGYATRNLAENSDAMTYMQQTLDNQVTVQRTIERKIGENLDVEYNLALVTNMICANVEYGQIEKIKKVNGVVDVFLDQMYYPAVVSEDSSVQPNMVFSSETMNVQQVWDTGYTGAGARIAIIDTGLDTDHQSVSESGYLYAMEENARENGYELVDDYLETLRLLDLQKVREILPELNVFTRGGSDASRLYLNKKIPFVFNYSTGSYDVTHDNDTAGAHGSHVAGIAAANRYIQKGDSFVDALDEVMVAGTAPDAQIMVFKVFGSNGASGWDILAAVEDAILLGADTINLSLGTVSPGYTTSTQIGAVLENLKNIDTVAVIAAGNNFDWAYLSRPGTLYADDVNTFTMGDPGSGTNSLSVASVENSGKIISGSLTVGGQMVSFSETSSHNPNYVPIIDMDKSADKQGTEYEYVYFEHQSYADSYKGYEDIVKDKFVLCSRGDNSFSDKANNAIEAGAIGVIIYNNVAGVLNMDLSELKYKVPCVSITKDAKGKFVDAGEELVGPDGKSYYAGTLKIAKGSVKLPAVEGTAYEMSYFSSWGVTGDLALKPEITAPGGMIYSINGGSKTSTSSYTTMSGTSMAAPQVAGIGALVQAYIEDHGYRATGFANSNRGLTQSILMSTAVPMKDANGNYFPVIQQGAGLVDAAAAVSADSYIKMSDSKATPSYDDGKVKAELGDDPDRTGSYSFAFSINNLDGQARTYNLCADVFAQDSYEAASKLGSTDGTPEYKTYYMDRSTRSLPADITFKVGREEASVVTVPANGSATVRVTIKLTEEGKEYLNTHFKNGSYVQAYVFAEPQTSEEGEISTIHSIPVLAFYGNWTDASMYYGVSTKEGQNYMNYSLPATTDHSRWPYFTLDGDTFYNYFRVSGSTGTYYLGGNPLVEDETYMPERNAVNSNFTSVYAEVWLARNTAQYQMSVTDVDTGVYYGADGYLNDIMNALMGAYLNNSGSYSGRFGNTLTLDTYPEEGANLSFAVQALPEYYMDGKKGENSTPGEGAYVRTTAVVDNTRPQVADIKYLPTEQKLLVTARDENYVSAVVLYNAEGNEVLSFEGAKQQIDKGEQAVYELDLSGTSGTDFFVQVFDYAVNMATFRVHLKNGVMNLSGAMLAFNQSTSNWVQIDKSVEKLQTAASSETVYNAATSIGNVVFALSADNYLYAASVDTLKDTKAIAQLDAAVTDLAYNAADEMLYGVTEQNQLLKIDPETGEAAIVGVLPIQTNTLACDASGTFYCNKYGTGEIYSFTMEAATSGIAGDYDFNGDDTVNALDGQLLLEYILDETVTLEHADCTDVDCDGDVDTYDVYTLQQLITYYPKQIAVVSGIKSKYLQSMECDPSNGTIYWASYFTDFMDGKEMGFSIFCEIDSESGEVTKHHDYWNQLTGLVVLDLNSSRTFPPASGIKNLTLNKTAAAEVGEEIKLQAAVVPWNTTDGEVVWHSSDESIARVDSNGIVQAVSDGVCKITATSVADNTLSAVCTITVGNKDTTSTSTEVCAVADVNNAQKNAYLTQQASMKTVDLVLTAVEKTCNGLQTISFDSDLLELLSISCDGLSAHTLSRNLVTLGFIPAEPIERDGTLATLTFRVKDGGLSADLLIRELQRNNRHINIETARNLESHIWGDWTETSAPTCGSDGVETRICSDCGDTETRALLATGEHSWGKWTTTADGGNIRSCTVCGESERSAAHSEDAHVWKDWQVTIPATCGEDGEKVGTCKDCGKTLTILLPATGNHTWNAWTTEEGGESRSRSCSGCDEVQTKVIVAGREGTVVEEQFNFFKIGKNYVRDVQIDGAEIVGVTLLDTEPEEGENDRLHYLIELSRSADTVDTLYAKFRVSEQSSSGIGSAFIDKKVSLVRFEEDVTDYNIDISSGTGTMTAWSYWDESSCMAVHLEFIISEDETAYGNPIECYGNDGYLDSITIWNAKVEKATGFVSSPMNSSGTSASTCVIWLDPSTPDDAVVGIQLRGGGNMHTVPEDWTDCGGYVQLNRGEAEISGIRYSAGGRDYALYRRDYRIILKNHHETMAPELLQGSEVTLYAEMKKTIKVNFADYFADGNGDALIYTYSVNGGEEQVVSNPVYRWTPSSTDAITLTVKASDGTFTTENCVITIQPVDGHVWGPWTITSVVTCTEDGEEVRKCRYCSNVTETNIVACAGQHTWGSWETVMDGSNEPTSRKMRACHACGETELSDVGFIYGDLDRDGKVDLMDVILMSRYLVNWEGLEIDLKAADVNCDNAVNNQDIVLLRRYLVGFDVTLGNAQ